MIGPARSAKLRERSFGSGDLPHEMEGCGHGCSTPRSREDPDAARAAGVISALKEEKLPRCMLCGTSVLKTGAAKSRATELAPPRREAASRAASPSSTLRTSTTAVPDAGDAARGCENVSTHWSEPRVESLRAALSGAAARQGQARRVVMAPSGARTGYEPARRRTGGHDRMTQNVGLDPRGSMMVLRGDRRRALAACGARGAVTDVVVMAGYVARDSAVHVLLARRVRRGVKVVIDIGAVIIRFSSGIMLPPAPRWAADNELDKRPEMAAAGSCPLSSSACCALWVIDCVGSKGRLAISGEKGALTLHTGKSATIADLIFRSYGRPSDRVPSCCSAALGRPS